MKMLHVTIQTNKFEEEVKFYEQYVGLKVQQDMRPMGRNMVFLAEEAEDTKIEIIEKAEGTDAGNENLSVGFHAENVDLLHDRLTADGFFPSPFVSPMPKVKFFFVKDPAGVNVQFM